MGCEFLGLEFRPDKDRTMHESQVCTASGSPCLTDDPLGHGNCTRRTWLLMQGIKTPEEKKKRRKDIEGHQAYLPSF
jgi:hypothetical protein